MLDPSPGPVTPSSSEFQGACFTYKSREPEAHAWGSPWAPPPVHCPGTCRVGPPQSWLLCTVDPNLDPGGPRALVEPSGDFHLQTCYARGHVGWVAFQEQGTGPWHKDTRPSNLSPLVCTPPTQETDLTLAVWLENKLFISKCPQEVPTGFSKTIPLIPLVPKAAAH